MGELSTSIGRTFRTYNLDLVTPNPLPTLRERLRRIFLATLLIVSGTALLVFSADYAIFKIRVATDHNAYGSIVVNHYYAVAQKNGKTQLIFDPPTPETCVNALFQHSGPLPCWYLRRHPDQRTNI